MALNAGTKKMKAIRGGREARDNQMEPRLEPPNNIFDSSVRVLSLVFGIYLCSSCLMLHLHDKEKYGVTLLRNVSLTL